MVCHTFFGRGVCVRFFFFCLGSPLCPFSPFFRAVLKCLCGSCLCFSSVFFFFIHHPLDYLSPRFARLPPPLPDVAVPAGTRSPSGWTSATPRTTCRCSGCFTSPPPLCTSSSCWRLLPAASRGARHPSLVVFFVFRWLIRESSHREVPLCCCC